MRTYVSVRGGRVSEVAADVVREQPLTIHVNGEKFLTLLCSPMMLEALVVGYLWMEKVIGDVEEIARVGVSPVDGRADVTVTHPVTLTTERIPTADRILLSTGRVSSEMLLKAARMGVPVVASRTSPTEMAVALAEQLNVTVCGYVRPDGLNLYAGEALVLDAEPASHG